MAAEPFEPIGQATDADVDRSRPWLFETAAALRQISSVFEIEAPSVYFGSTMFPTLSFPAWVSSM